jgi:hypothetical protein
MPKTSLCFSGRRPRNGVFESDGAGIARGRQLPSQQRAVTVRSCQRIHSFAFILRILRTKRRARTGIRTTMRRVRDP